MYIKFECLACLSSFFICNICKVFLLSMADSILDFEKQITPYYTAKHEEYRLHVRKFRETHIDPYVKSILSEPYNILYIS